MYAPDVNTDGRLWLRQARHPLLVHLFREEASGRRQPADGASNQPADAGRSPGKTVVPIDIRLGFGFNLLIITGPNTGGKTVCLKTAGLLCLMAQCGMHVPAGEGSNVPIFHRILADIGDEQSLEQSLSTFSSHISRIAFILKEANAQSLVLLDELGAGTDPTEGAALGRAILDGLDERGCRAMVTTHLGDLKTYAFHNERAENGAVEFDVETLRPTYRLHIGQYGMSNALRIARRLKLPRDLLKRAHKYLRRRQKRARRWPSYSDCARKLKRPAKRRWRPSMRRSSSARNCGTRPRRWNARRKKRRRCARRGCDCNRATRSRCRASTSRAASCGWITSDNLAVVSVGLGQWEVPLDDVFPAEK